MEAISEKKMSGAAQRVLAVFLGTALNVLLAFIIIKVDLPFYLDTIGTVAVAMIGGIFPGIMTAVATNFLCTFFNGDSLYFTIVNVLIAIFAGIYARRKALNRKTGVVGVIAAISLMSGVFSTAIQWGLYHAPQNASVADAVSVLGDATGISANILFFLVNVVLNILDKVFSVFAALLIVHFIPAQVGKAIRDSGWKQAPLSEQEMDFLNHWGSDVKNSMRYHLSLLFIGIVAASVIIVGWISLKIYFRSSVEEEYKAAESTLEFAVDIVASSDIEAIITEGREAEDYEETERFLANIVKNSPHAERISVFRKQGDGFAVVMDLKKRETVEDFSVLPDFEEPLREGKPVEPREYAQGDGRYMSTFYPVYNDNGKLLCYVGLDVSLNYIRETLMSYSLKVIMIISGFLLLILSCGFWISGFYIVYPLNSIAACIEDFVEADNDQAVLDSHVKKLRELDIHTDDEVEKMYHAISRMAEGMAEQFREIRYYSSSTEMMQNGLIVTMADLVESRDSDTGAHVQKTAAYVQIILDGLKRKGYYEDKLTPKYMKDVVMSAPLHDVGKINIPDAVLNKPGKLTEEEYTLMKTHATAGKEIMERVISTVRGETYLKEARNMAAYHHERWDGKGYPEGLSGEAIPLAARIMAVADVFDALSSPRVYKPAFPLEKALEMIREGAGSQFDPKCVEVFFESLSEVKLVLKKYQNS